MVEFLFVVPATSCADDPDGLPTQGEDDGPELPSNLPDGELAQFSGLIAVQLKDRSLPHG